MDPIYVYSMKRVVYSAFDLIMENITAYVPHEQVCISEVNDKVKQTILETIYGIFIESSIKIFQYIRDYKNHILSFASTTSIILNHTR